MNLQVAGMDALLGGDDGENTFLGWGELFLESGMEQAPGGSWHEAVGVEKVFFDVELGILLFEITGAVALYAVAKNEILRACGRANGIGLDETEPFDGCAKRGGPGERRSNGVSFQCPECHFMLTRD